MNELKTVNDWIPLGLNLGVEISTLEAIERERITIGERCTHMLNEWQKQKNPTWSAVIQALVKMGMRHLALQLAQKKGSFMLMGVNSAVIYHFFILQKSLYPSHLRTRLSSNYRIFPNKKKLWPVPVTLHGKKSANLSSSQLLFPLTKGEWRYVYMLALMHYSCITSILCSIL